MPSIFISNVMPRMPQLFGAVRIGPTRASENPDIRYRRSGDAEFEVPNHTSVTRRELRSLV